MDLTVAMIEGGHRVIPRFFMQGMGDSLEPVYITVEPPKRGERRRRHLGGLRNYIAWTSAESFIQSEVTNEFVITRLVTRTSMNVCLRSIRRDKLKIETGITLHAIRLLTPESFPADIEDLLPPESVRLTESEQVAMKDFIESDAVRLESAVF